MKLYNEDCMNILKEMENNSVNSTITDIPYTGVNRDSNGLRNLDKGKADILNIELEPLLNEIYRVSSDNIIMFCGSSQYSYIYNYFKLKKKGTVRTLVWQKTNPSPMNGQYVYLSGVEFAIYYKKPKGTFNAHCKNTVFKHSNGSSKIHPTQKNLKLFEELILDNTNEGQIVLDPFMGSGTTGVACKKLNREFIGVELDQEYFEIAKKRIENE